MSQNTTNAEKDDESIGSCIAPSCNGEMVVYDDHPESCYCGECHKHHNIVDFHKASSGLKCMGEIEAKIEDMVTSGDPTDDIGRPGCFYAWDVINPKDPDRKLIREIADRWSLGVEFKENYHSHSGRYVEEAVFSPIDE